MLKETDIEIFEAIQKEKKRQEENIELIASENFVSEAVLESESLKKQNNLINCSLIIWITIKIHLALYSVFTPVNITRTVRGFINSRIWKYRSNCSSFRFT